MGPGQNEAMSTTAKWVLTIAIPLFWVAVVRTVMTGAPDRSMGLLDLIPVALIWWVWGWKWKPDESGSHDSKVPTPSPVISASPPAPIPEYPHTSPAATSKPDDLGQQMSDSAPDQPQSSVLPCSECGHENPAEVNFCTKCRAKIVLECADCGFKSPQGSEFCGSCGKKTEFAMAREARHKENLQKVKRFATDALSVVFSLLVLMFALAVVGSCLDEYWGTSLLGK